MNVDPLNRPPADTCETTQEALKTSSVWEDRSVAPLKKSPLPLAFEDMVEKSDKAPRSLKQRCQMGPRRVA